MAKNQGKEKKNGLISTLFTVEVFGMALALLCVLVLLRLTVGDILFGQVGEEIGQFFFGVFGYLSFPILVLLGFLGIKALLGFKVQNRAVKRFTKYFFIYALLVSLVSHTALNQIALSFEEYIDYCYQAGVTISSSTFGGVAIGSLAHFVANFLTKTGSFVVYSLLIAITTITLFRNKISQMIIASKSGEKQSKKESKKARKEKKNADADEEPISANSFEYESSEEVETRPTRTVIFGGGAFEKKSDGDKNSSSAGVKVLFGSETFGRKSSVNNNSFAYTSPITTEKSYREKYDEDIARKTEFVRKPAESVPGRVYSPMGERATTEVPSFLSNQENTMDIDVSEPEKDIYVFNRGGKTRENISLFDKKVRESDLNTRSFENDNSNEYNRDRFTPYTESGDLNGFTISSREEFKTEERNSFARRENPFTQEERRDDFARRENPFVQEERRDDFTRRENPFVQEERRDDFTRRENPFVQEERRDDFATRENPFTYERQNESFERDERNSFVSTNSGENEDAMPSRTTFETRETFTERDRFNANEGRRENFNEQVSVAPDYNDENGFSSGSFFSAEDRTRTPKVSFNRDRAHSTSTVENEQKPAFMNSINTSGVTARSTETAKPIMGKQMSMDSIPEENQLINPIDNIPKNYKYAFPPINLLLDYSVDEKAQKKNEEEQLKRAETIIQILKNGNIEAKIEDIKYGPAITRFELSIPPTVSVKRITEKYEDLNLWIAARDKIRLVAPIQGTSRIGIEVPNASPATVGLKGLIESREFKGAKQSSLSFCLGKDIVGRPVILDIAKMPHLLVAGATGTGKSVFLNTLLVSLIYKYSPEELRIILVDPKVVEFSIFRGIPNLMFNEIFTDNAKVCSMLEWAVQEMEDRYQKLNAVLAKNIEEYNGFMEKKKGKKIPKLLIIIDEFADLMNSSSERKLMENKISRLAAKARAAGIHLIMATQRPSADIMEGSIKTNFTSRIAFKMSSPTDAMVIMGEAGADKLLGRGDVLFRTSSMPSAERAQGCFIDTPEIDQVCKYIKEHNECYYDEFALEKILKGAQSEDTSAGDYIPASGDSTPAKSDEEFIKKAMRLAITANNISISGMQRKLGIGFPKAGKLMDTLVERGYVSESVDNKNRKILMTKEQFESVFGEPF